VQETGFAIEAGTKEKGQLEAKISELTAEINESDSKTEELAAAIASNEGDVERATVIREQEVAEFIKNEKVMIQVVNAVERAIGILEKEMLKNPASFAQTYRN